MAQEELVNPQNSYQQSELFLWFHVALLTALPLTLSVAMLGLGVGNPVLPEWLEIIVLGLPAIALPIFWQWQRPLSPFSLWLWAKPLELTTDAERRILAVVKDVKTPLVAIALGFIIDALFCKIYALAPLVEGVLPLPPALRIVGVVWWSGFFLVSNCLLQAGAVAIRVLLLSPSALDRLSPLPLDKINQGFTSFGRRSPQLLALSTPNPESPEKIPARPPSPESKLPTEVSTTEQLPKSAEDPWVD